MEIPLAERTRLAAHEVFPRWALYGFQLSPDGQRLSYVHQRERRVADLCLLPSQGGYPQPFTSAGDFTQPAVWSPDGAWLAVEHDGKLKLIAVDGSQARWIYQDSLYNPPAAQENSAANQSDAQLAYPRFAPDGQSILFAARADYHTILRQVSVDGTWRRDLYAFEGLILSWEWSPDGRAVLLTTRNEDGWTGEIRLVDVDSGAVHTISQEAHYEYQPPLALWAADDQVVLRSNRSGWSKLWVIDLANQRARPLTTGDWDDNAFCLSPRRDQVVYASRRDQPGSAEDLWIASLSGGEARRLTQQPGVQTPFAWSASGEIFYWHSSPGEPGDLWSVSTQGGAPQRLTFSAQLSLERKLRPALETLIPNHESDHPVPALVYLPVDYQEGQRCPAIVWIHGGPSQVADYGYNRYCSWLANLGYVVIFPQYRGSAGLGVAHMSAVSGEGLGKHDLSDVLAAGRYAQTLPYVDLSRGVGVGGASWGGYLTLMAITQAPELFSCAYAGAAISDWFIQQTHTEVRYYDRWLVGGWIYEQPERAKERSPVTFVERLKTPLLVLHGEQDTSVPYSQIEAFVEKARQGSAEVDFVAYPLEGHMLRKPENQQDALERIQAFFQRYLKPWNYRDNPYANQI
jgi:dipeptidyl aminopeptidase/acylaminoacyl peptidase